MSSNLERSMKKLNKIIELIVLVYHKLHQEIAKLMEVKNTMIMYKRAKNYCVVHVTIKKYLNSKTI